MNVLEILKNNWSEEADAELLFELCPPSCSPLTFPYGYDVTFSITKDWSSLYSFI